MTTLLALDLSTRKNGFCAGNGAETPIADAFLLPSVGEDIGAMLCALDDNLNALFERFRPGLVLYEAPILPSDAGRGTLLIRRKLFCLGGHVEFVCRRRGVTCLEAGVRAIKRELAGTGNASKDDMVFAAERCGIALPATKEAGREDAADAFGLWLLGLRQVNRALSARWDQRLWSSRGALI